MAHPRPRLGELLRSKELVSENELEEALRLHRDSGRPLGEVLTETLGMVSIAELRDLLAVQRRWRPLGQMLLERRLLSEEQLLDALEEQARTGRPLGEVVRTRFLLSSTALDNVLQDQRELEIELDRGYTSGLRAALRRRTRGDAAAPEAGADDAQGAPFGLTGRLAFATRSEAHTHLAVRHAEMSERKATELGTLLEEQRGELVHLRELLTDRQLAVIELEERVRELEAELAAGDAKRFV